MIYAESFTELENIRDTAVMVGKFDGIHRGHELLAKKICEKKEEGLTPVLLTFDTSIRTALTGEPVQTLITMEERRLLFASLGIDVMLVLPFTEALSHTSPRDFITLLTEKLSMKYIVAGTDFRFGYRGAGDAALLRSLSKELGFTAEIVEKLCEDTKEISSTRIRDEIRAGRIENANRLLGYPYFLWGTVVHGAHIGTGLGVPTLNIEPPATKLLPPRGVYVTAVRIDGKTYRGMTNVGVKPTVEQASGERRPVNVETHLLHFQGDLYQKNVEISFLTFLRKEEKFPSLAALKEQLSRDRAAAEAYTPKKRDGIV